MEARPFLVKEAMKRLALLHHPDDRHRRSCGRALLGCRQSRHQPLRNRHQ
jgi:hypothetical protein